MKYNLAYMLTLMSSGKGEQLKNVSPDQTMELSGHQVAILQAIVDQLSKGALPESQLKCPECGRPFSKVSLNDYDIDVCRYCRSIWFDAGELKAVTDLADEVPSMHLASRKSKYACPVCEVQMNEYVFKAPHNVMVDQCTEGHGVYLESSELVRVLKIANE
jgi:Zn-finger nucleic acid-binding protein